MGFVRRCAREHTAALNVRGLHRLLSLCLRVRQLAYMITCRLLLTSVPVVISVSRSVSHYSKRWKIGSIVMMPNIVYHVDMFKFFKPPQRLAVE